MFLVHELLTPAGTLRVEDTWQEIYADLDDGAEPVLIGRSLALRAAYLDGVLLPWSPSSRDLFAAAADAIDGGPRGWTQMTTISSGSGA